ncbi:hypothetical protein TA3x_005639 [Tundrisphaera sp. TA3]|uniref:hypothetical protein n=1 Tax=Tundrisphaera sp. TA3 TaxID=3435775 RepID=UPI003EBA1415
MPDLLPAGRVDTYILPATKFSPEARIELKWGAGDAPAAGHLVVSIPAKDVLVEVPLEGFQAVEVGIKLPATTGKEPEWLHVKLAIHAEEEAEDGGDAGSYEFRARFEQHSQPQNISVPGVEIPPPPPPPPPLPELYGGGRLPKAESPIETTPVSGEGTGGSSPPPTTPPPQPPTPPPTQPPTPTPPQAGGPPTGPSPGWVDGIPVADGSTAGFAGGPGRDIASPAATGWGPPSAVGPLPFGPSTEDAGIFGRAAGRSATPALLTIDYGATGPTRPTAASSPGGTAIEIQARPRARVVVRAEPRRIAVRPRPPAPDIAEEEGMGELAATGVAFLPPIAAVAELPPTPAEASPAPPAREEAPTRRPRLVAILTVAFVASSGMFLKIARRGRESARSPRRPGSWTTRRVVPETTILS